MTGRPAPQPEPAFSTDLFADRRDAQRARAWIVAALTATVLAVCAALWWFDRVAAPPSFRPTLQPHTSWVAPFDRQERAVARLEERDDRP